MRTAVGAFLRLHLVLRGAAIASEPRAMDPRNMHSGSVIHVWDYSDQPYCVVMSDPKHLRHAGVPSAKSLFVCTVTVNDAAREGKSGEHVVSVLSSDQGKTWSKPVALERSSVQLGIDNAYSTIVLTPSGRIYAAYNMNVDQIHSLNGRNISRVDELGQFVMRYSDDAGQSWSAERYVIPYRETAVDWANSFSGKTKIMWTVDQSKIRNGTVYFAFTKIGSYTQNPPQEGFFLASDNLLHESNPAKITWKLLPEGNHGTGPIGANCAWPANSSDCVAEEWHIVPLAQTSGFFTVFRTSQGVLGASRTTDPTGKSGWVPSYPAQFVSSRTAPGRSGGALKNPRGPITLKRFSNGKYLLLWYNNGETGFGNGKDGEDLNNRMPYWLSAGTETQTGEIVFTMPEIVLYNRSAIHNSGSGVARPGYPDFIEDVDGSIFITETNKQAALCHRVDPLLLKLLWEQQQSNSVAGDRLVVSFDGGSTQKRVAQGVLPNFAQSWQPGAGLTIEMWVADHSKARPSNSTNGLVQVGPGFKINITKRSSVPVAPHGYGVSLWLNDGVNSEVFSLDPTCALTLALPGKHHVAAIIDAGPRIVLWLVDGFLCDGGVSQTRGWAWITAPLRDLNGKDQHQQIQVGNGYGGTILGGRLYGRALHVSEVVGNYHAGLPNRTI